MAQIVVKPFHLDGVLKDIGDALTSGEERKLMDWLKSEDAAVAGQARELLHRCVRTAESAVNSVATASVATLKRFDPSPDSSN
jgi:hypothetical protein